MKLARALFGVVLMVAFAFAIAGCGDAETVVRDVPQTAEVPDVLGMTSAEASVTVYEAGLDPLIFTAEEHAGVEIMRFDGRETDDKVTLTYPKAGTVAAGADDVSILIGEAEVPPSDDTTTGPFWFQHKFTVAKLGDTQCKTCHKGDYCATCHAYADASAPLTPRGETWSAEGGAVATSIAGYAIRVVGEGSMTEPGLRGVSGKDGGDFLVEITLRSVASPESVREDTAEIADKVFAFHGPALVKSLEFRWYQQGSSAPSGTEIVENATPSPELEPADLYPDLEPSDLR